MQHDHDRFPTQFLTIAAAALVALAVAVTGAAAAVETPPSQPAASATAAAAAVDLNTASASQLQAVPGIGPATAARIIAFRDEHGPFRRVDDLIKIRGIGETTLRTIRPHVKVATKD